MVGLVERSQSVDVCLTARSVSIKPTPIRITAIAVGRDVFRSDANAFIELLMQVQSECAENRQRNLCILTITVQIALWKLMTRCLDIT